MSGDVQPRKRKDKKKKKDELGIEEPRGTAAVLGEGDVFMHSQHEHGTGGHWCAKVIFFSLLAILIGLIGLIILENRGLSELEANAVESRYSGVFDGWLEDSPDDDHHDVHTLELKHHDEDDHGDVFEHEDEHDEEDHDLDEHDDDNGHNDDDEDEEHDDEEHDEDDEEHDDEDEQDNEDEESLEHAEDEDEEENGYNKYLRRSKDDQEDNEVESNEDDEENEGDKENDENDEENDEYDEENNDDDNTEEDNNDEEDLNEPDDEDQEEDQEIEEDTEIEVEKIENEPDDEEPISLELPALPEDDDDGDESNDNDEEDETPDEDEDEEDVQNDSNGDDDDDFLEADDDLPLVEKITAPKGKPFIEVEEDDALEQPPDTLEEEEEYEKQQEEKRREKEQASHMWLKLVVGGALLVATHAVVRRASAPRDEPETEEVTREDSPVNIDRRLTLIAEETSTSVTSKPVYHQRPEPIVQEVVKSLPTLARSAPVQKQPSEEEEDEPDQELDEGDQDVVEEVEEEKVTKKEVDKELYSDEEELEEEEEVEEEKVEPKIAPKADKPPPPVPEPEPESEEDVPDDVEIIDDEQVEEELDDEEEEISDVDDVELLTRLEAKYGRLPEPERPGFKKDGGNSVEDDWPGEPSDAFWRQELDSAEQELRQGAYASAVRRAGAPELSGSGRARWVVAAALDRDADDKRDNAVLSRAIVAYINLLKMNENLSDKKLLEITNRTLDRIQFRGTYLSAEPVYRLLIRRFPNELAYRNNLTVSYLMSNRMDLAEEIIKETLQRWPNDRISLANYGFILKNLHNRLEDAVDAFQKALEGDTGPACQPRFYYNLGDALLLLGRYTEAHEVHKRGAKHGHFLSPAQRSIYNVARLKSQPWWNIDNTPYTKLARALEKSWKAILKEGMEAQALYEKEKEGLKERGEWSQLDLFARGHEIPGRCKRAPITCSIVQKEPAAVGCRRGQIKFSLMEPGTHVRPHVGPTNCRLRMHLGLSNTKDTYLRVDQETRQWQEGKVLVFDDSFEHEVWHNGTGKRLVLIVDLWHPDLTVTERRQLPAI